MKNLLFLALLIVPAASAQTYGPFGTVPAPPTCTYKCTTKCIDCHASGQVDTSNGSMNIPGDWCSEWACVEMGMNRKKDSKAPQSAKVGPYHKLPIAVPSGFIMASVIKAVAKPPAPLNASIATWQSKSSSTSR